MTKYQVSYVCSCEDGTCTVKMERNEGVVGPPAVCVLGKNVSSVLENGCSKWELKAERLRRDDRQGA